jgi:hypothetical protein
MNEPTEAVWRKALQAKGKEWVLAELHRRAGQPGDVLLDVVFEEPYPTRAFCRQWCAEVDSRLFNFSWHTQAAIVAMVLFIVCCIKAIQSFSPALPPRSAARVAAMPTSATAITNTIPSATSAASSRSR